MISPVTSYQRAKLPTAPPAIRPSSMFPSAIGGGGWGTLLPVCPSCGGPYKWGVPAETKTAWTAGMSLIP